MSYDIKKLNTIVAEWCGWRCGYCGRKIERLGVHRGNGQIDHLRPRSNGTVGIGLNLMLACVECNGGKMANDESHWKIRRALIRMGMPKPIVRAQVEWIAKTFGPIPVEPFWYETHPLPPLTTAMLAPAIKGPRPYSSRPKPVNVAKVRALKARGYTAIQIAAELKCSRQYVYKALRK